MFGGKSGKRVVRVKKQLLPPKYWVCSLHTMFFGSVVRVVTTFKK
jgi:hypothetical protein